MTVLMILVLLVYLAAAVLIARYFMHMLQLSSYQFQGYFRFLRNEWKSWCVLPAGLIPMALMLAGKQGAGLVTGLVFLAFLVWSFRPKAAKKKFVVTARVKRLIATCAVLFVLCVGGGALLWRNARGGAVLLSSAALLLLPLLVALANLINGPIEKAVQNWYINDARRILARNPDLTIIGVTGSYGKTSVKFALKTILSEGYRTLMTPASYNTPMGAVRTIREELEPTHEIFICEMGARHVGDIREICDIVHPVHGIVTSVGPQHLETFHSLENIVGTKFELLDEVAANGKGGKKFVNGDSEPIMSHPKYSDWITYGLGEHNAYRARIQEVTRRGTVFEVTAPDGESEVFRMPLLGSHNVVNVTGCIAIAHELGMPLKKCKAGVRKLEGAPHRLQLIDKGGVTIIDDAYNANPAGTRAALEVLGLFDAVRVLVTPGMVELGTVQAAENEAFGEAAAKCADYIVIVGRENLEAIRKGVLSAGFDQDKLIAADTIDEAAKIMYELEPGKEKVILLENDLPDNYS